MNGVMVKAPGKLNLSLDILGVLPNGYHKMDMLMQTVDLFEKVIITKAKGITVRCIGSDGTPVDGIPTDRHNTAFKAAMMFFDVADIAGGAEIAITKAVPVKAGMGGSSADAAAVLVGLNHLYDEPLSVDKLCKIGADVGADVPFAIVGGTCRVAGIGDVITPVTPLDNCFIAVGMPSVGVSTKDGFASFDKSGSHSHVDLDEMEKYLKNNDLTAFCAMQKNVMQPSCGTQQTKTMCEILRASGALSALMTGSGAAVYGIFKTLLDAQKGCEALGDLAQTTYCVTPFAKGAYVENCF
ncbi:MAG: 4-(cytidine 5'-diphospho)-2-C-methyl-D-erythritol kinase [Oscillospiraceae bacterium]